MEENVNNPSVKVISPEARRVRASGPILLLAFLFVVGAFLTWYFTWFGRSLSDADIAQYLVDEKHPRRVQHALLQIQQRIEQKDPNAKQWYPQLVTLSHHKEPEFRLTVAWIMGFDNQSKEFHQALLELLNDPQAIVRRNAALALVRFNDPSGRAELASVLTPYQIVSPAEGVVDSTLKEGSTITRGTLVGRITEPTGKVIEVRSPLPGKIAAIQAASRSTVVPNSPLVSVNSDEQSVWESLRGLSLIGGAEDLPVIERYAQDGAQAERIRKQAALTASAIKGRQTSGQKS